MRLERANPVAPKLKSRSSPTRGCRRTSRLGSPSGKREETIGQENEPPDIERRPLHQRLAAPEGAGKALDRAMEASAREAVKDFRRLFREEGRAGEQQGYRKRQPDSRRRKAVKRAKRRARNSDAEPERDTNHAIAHGPGEGQPAASSSPGLPLEAGRGAWLWADFLVATVLALLAGWWLLRGRPRRPQRATQATQTDPPVEERVCEARRIHWAADGERRKPLPGPWSSRHRPARR